jgi:hypothetical protein
MTRRRNSGSDECARDSCVSGCYLRLCQRPAVVIVILALLNISVMQAQQPKVPEYEVKATYLYNFGRFVQWDPDAAAAKTDLFSFCVLGQDPFGATLDSTLAGETLEGKPLAVRRIATPRDALQCRILFISSKEENHLKEILDALGNSGVLTVSDMPAFSSRGGMIGFVLEGGKVRFEINLTKAETAKLVLSSELLKVATTVRRNARQVGL